MAQIHVNNLTFSYEGSFDNIFEQVSFSIDTNWKLGFIGRNGKGKTTFLNLLLGKYPYTGSIHTSTVFDYFPYTVTKAQMQLPAAEFIETLKPQCELWRVICELDQLTESEEIPSGHTSIPSGARVPCGNNEDIPCGHTSIPSGARVPCGDCEEIPSGHTSMPCGNNEDIPSGHTSMPCGDCEEIPSGHTSMPYGNYEEILYRPFGLLSPGERTKILLAVLFSGENDFLLIDEPTNHLDQASREQVKAYLASKKGFILVSHDRDLLDACVDHVLVLNRQTIEVQSGNFSSWWENKQRKDQFAKAENEKHLKEISKLKQAAARTSQWADKNESTKIGFDPAKEPDRSIGTRPYIGAKTKKMQSRVKQMEQRMSREIREKEGLLVDLEQTVDLKLTPLLHHKETLVNIREYTLQYTDAKTPVFSDLTFSVHRGDRIALYGENGCGKSTLIKMILQKAGITEHSMPVIESGVCETAAGLVISYVNQDTSMLRGGISEFCIERNLDQSLFCAILRQLGFERVQFLKNMEDYSAGQKKKALLAASLLTPAHLYVWDEPLNYIDVFSRMQIEKLLLEYQPTMLFVEHDVRFREKIATAEIAFV